MAEPAPALAQALREDARLAVQCCKSPAEQVFEVRGRFSAGPNVIASSPSTPEANRAGEVSSRGNFWFPRVYGVSNALYLNVEANPADFHRGSVEGAIPEITPHFSAGVELPMIPVCKCRAGAGAVHAHGCPCPEHPCTARSRPLLARVALPDDAWARCCQQPPFGLLLAHFICRGEQNPSAKLSVDIAGHIYTHVCVYTHIYTHTLNYPLCISLKGVYLLHRYWPFIENIEIHERDISGEQYF